MYPGRYPSIASTSPLTGVDVSPSAARFVMQNVRDVDMFRFNVGLWVKFTCIVQDASGTFCIVAMEV
jgi:hypothetical protein